MTRAILASIALTAGLMLLLLASLLWTSIPYYVQAPAWQSEHVTAYQTLAAIEDATGRAFTVWSDGRITLEIED